MDSLDAGFAYFSLGVPHDAESGPDLAGAAERVKQALAPWGRGREYTNFAERPADGEARFGAATYHRLRDLRQRVDPDRLFRANQEI